MIPLAGPAYYSIMRNTLYLSPGDDMEIYVNEDNHEARFTGRGAEANTYMKGRLFPKGGSFLLSGENIRADYPSTKALIDSLARGREMQLAALEHVSEEFRDLERARILADVVNSEISYPGYAATKTVATITSEEEFKKLMADFSNRQIPDIRPLFEQLTDERYLDVAVVRDILSLRNAPEYKEMLESVSLPQRSVELLEAAKYKRELNWANDPAVAIRARDFVAGMQQPDFKQEMELTLAKSTRLAKGSPAIDLRIEDEQGQTKMLSDFRGQVIYIDLWATWCGPCLQEAPAFEALAGKFKGNDDIVFLQISTDAKTATWESHIDKEGSALPQYITHDPTLTDGWRLSGIPRFILIDSDFNIIEAVAPMPSDANTEELLRNALKQHPEANR